MTEDEEFADKIRSINFGGKRRGKSETKLVEREDGPGVAGSTTEHWDGRIDATVTPPAININSTVPVPGG